MRNLLLVAMIAAFFAFAINTSLQAQIEVDVKSKTENEANQRANSKTDEAIDKGFDAIENGIGGLFKKKKKKETKETKEPKEAKTSQQEASQDQDPDQQVSTLATEDKKPADQFTWSKYDFIPGDVVIFEDKPDQNEENGEFPSRWDLVKGNTEIAEFNGEKVIMFRDGNPTIIPYLENSDQDYLPEVFTVELDIYRPKNGNRFSIYLYDDKNQSHFYDAEIEVSYNYASLANVRTNYPGVRTNESQWTHIAIAYTRGKLKVYFDDARLVNIPHYEGNPSGITLQAYWADNDKLFFVKNVRIAKGGVKYYDRVLSEGKIVVNGIKFDINKTSLKPESMGPINKIYDLLIKNPEIKFSVEGHTDSDGDADANQKLSEGRAKAVMNKLIELGISADRLSSKGWGESKPIDNNTTPEGKANNRRVEFIKI